MKKQDQERPTAVDGAGDCGIDGPATFAGLIGWKPICEICQNWERVEDPYKIRTRKGLPVLTNHHPNCPHYNDSLMDVWKVTHDGTSCYVDNEQDAEDTAGTEASGDTVSIVKMKMHREVFENLPEFYGF